MKRFLVIAQFQWDWLLGRNLYSWGLQSANFQKHYLKANGVA